MEVIVDPFKDLADRAHFNIYHSDLWRGTARRFAESIVRECANACGSQLDRANILKAFGLVSETEVKYTVTEDSDLGVNNDQEKDQD